MLITAIIAGALTLSGAAAYAAIPDSGGTIHGCRSDLTHVLTVRDPAIQAHCPLLNTAVDFAAQGPEGPQGLAGPQGVAGAVGPGAIFYKVSGGASLEVGQTSVAVSVSCSSPGDVMVSGGFGFDMTGLPYPGSVAVPLVPAPQNLQVERSLMRRPGISPIAENYEFRASFDPYAGGPSGAGVEIRAICMTTTP